MWRGILLAASIVVSPAAAEDTAITGTFFETGNNLYEWCVTNPQVFLGNCYAYIAGIADTMSNREVVFGWQACVPAGVTLAQLKDVVVLSLYQNAAHRHYQAAGLIAKALQQNFPCAP